MRKKNRSISMEYFSQITFLAVELNGHIFIKKAFKQQKCLYIVTRSLKIKEKSVLKDVVIFPKLKLNGITCICYWTADYRTLKMAISLCCILLYR